MYVLQVKFDFGQNLLTDNLKMARFGFCVASSLIWGDGGLLFHIILSKIVGWFSIFFVP